MGGVGSFRALQDSACDMDSVQEMRKKKNRMSLANLDEGEASGVGKMSQRSKERKQGS